MLSYEIGFSIIEMANNSVVTYNLHGLNNGKSGLIELCDNPSVIVIAVQEHWLSSDNLYLLNNIHPDFTGIGVSSMDDRLSKEVYRGRPYGGVAFLWRRIYSHRIHVQARAQSGRGLSVSVNYGNVNTLHLVNVYLPCYNSSAEYRCELAECLSFIKDIVADGHDTVVLGDMNFPCDMNHAGYRECFNLLSKYNIYHCNDLMEGDVCVTYRNDKLNHSSFIDHVFISNSIRHHIINVKLFDSGSNLSDHIPVVVNFDFQLSVSRTCSQASKKGNKYFAWRWDKSCLSSYYEASRIQLGGLGVPHHLGQCEPGCSEVDHISHINDLYNSIVCAL